MTIEEKNYWRKCSSCKGAIGLGAKYYQCNVSTCNTNKTNYVFCSVNCFETHLPGARHKDAYAIEETAPKTSTPQRIIVGGTPAPVAASATGKSSLQSREVLIIASRLKDYIHLRSEFNTSGGVMDVLSDYIRVVCDHAIDNARAEGRKTVLDRDFDFLKKQR